MPKVKEKITKQDVPGERKKATPGLNPEFKIRQMEQRKRKNELRSKYAGGGRTRLLEELGRVEAEPSNRNRRAEISRVHSELNKGYRSGGVVLKGKKVGCQIK